MADELEVLPPLPRLPAYEEQPELLDVTQYARHLNAEELVRQGSCLPASPTDTINRCSNQRTGKILLKQLRNDAEFAEALCAALALGMSARMVAKRFCIAPLSVAVVREAMTERGELKPVRLRVQAKIDRLAEDGLDETWNGVMAGAIHPGQGWIPTLATVDKRAQAEAGLVPGTDKTVEQVTVDRLMAARELVLASRRAAESDSGGGSAETTGPVGSSAANAGAATGPATGLTLPAPSGAVRLAVPGRHEAEPAGRAGGGSASGAAPSRREGSGFKISQPKEASSEGSHH